MIKLLLKNFLYLLIFSLCNLTLFSFSSSFHKLLNYDLNTLEEWLYHNRLYIITVAKLFTLFFILVLPNVYYVKLDIIKHHLKMWKIDLYRLWKLDSKFWLVNLFNIFLLYSLFYNLEINQQSQIYGDWFFNLILSMIFWSCDLLFIKYAYKDNVFTNYPQHRIINAGLQALLMTLTTAIVSYFSWIDLLQFFLISYCVFYLIQFEITKFSGYVTFFIFFLIMSVMRPLNFISNIDESQFNLIADSFSLPWGFIFIVYFFLFQNFIYRIIIYCKNLLFLKVNKK